MPSNVPIRESESPFPLSVEKQILITKGWLCPERALGVVWQKGVTRMRIKRSYLAVFALIVALSVIIGYGFWKHPTEPSYNGIPLSAWLEGTAGGNGIVSPEMLVALRANPEEVIPWLLDYLKTDPSPFQRPYALFYLRVHQPSRLIIAGKPGPSAPGNRWAFFRKWLPTPRTFRTAHGRYYGLPLLAELAPGTAFERQTLEYLIAPQSQTGIGNSHTRIDRLQLVGNFTNYPDVAIPILLAGLTNAGTAGVCIGSLQRFGASAVPGLSRMARSETGFIRPAEVALEKIDAAAYQKIREENQKVRSSDFLSSHSLSSDDFYEQRFSREAPTQARNNHTFRAGSLRNDGTGCLPDGEGAYIERYAVFAWAFQLRDPDTVGGNARAALSEIGAGKTIPHLVEALAYDENIKIGRAHV